MASLRRTRRFSSSPTPRELQHSPDSYYDHLRTPEVVESASAPRSGESSKIRDETRSRSVRKVRSQLAVNPPDICYNGEREHGGIHCALDHGASPGNTEFRSRKKRHGKSVRSQSARPRDLGDDAFSSRQATASGEDIHRTPTPSSQPSSFLVPKSRSRSQSRSSSAMPSYLPVTHTQDNSRSSTSRSYQPAAIDSRPRSKRRRAATARSQSRSSSEDDIVQKSPKLSRLPTPSSRAASPLPPHTPTLNMPDFDSSSRIEHACRSTSSAVPVSSRAPLSLSSLPLNTHGETPRKKVCDTPSSLSSRARSHSRASQASPLPIPPSQPSARSAPRTLQDVTRRLEENQGRLSKKVSTYTESTAHGADPIFSEQPSPGAIPIPLRNRNRQELDADVHSSALDLESRTSKERSRMTQTRPRYGLALTNEDGHRLGERTTQNSLPDHSAASKKATTPEVTTQHSPVSAHLASSSRHVDALGSDPLMKSNDCSDRLNRSVPLQNASGDTQQHWQDTVNARVPASLVRGNGCAKDEAIQPRDVSRTRSPLTYQPSFEEQDLRQRSSRHDAGTRVRRLDTTIPSVLPPGPPSSLPKPPLKPILVSRAPSTPVHSVLPHLPAPRTARAENLFSHKPNTSDTSASSLPRLRKLVIRNPGPGDGASSASSNPGTPKPDLVDSSGEFTVFALSASQNSMATPTSKNDYLVPDDVAAEVANDEERRRRALVGLVNDLHLASSDQARELPAHRFPKTGRSRSSWSSVAPRQKSHQQRGVEDDDEEDDDAFFARLSMHDDGGSLLEEPQPQADSGFRDDDDVFDEENSDFDDETEIEDGEEEEEDPPLPPTPKFVHPLGEGDDLESRITRVASLNRISPTPPSSISRPRRLEQGSKLPPRSDFPPSLQPLRIPSRGEAGNCNRIISNETVSERPERTWPRGNDLETQYQAIPSNINRPGPSPTGHVRDESLSSQSQTSISVSENEPSLVGGGRLSDSLSVMEETLSSGAEALFKQLQVEADAQQAVHLGEMTASEPYLSPQGDLSCPREEISSSQNAGNGSLTKSHEPTLLRTWRSTLPYGAYDSLAERHGPSEMRRQEIIWELCETEQAFVKSLRLILRLFVQPLRHQDKTWISGVPRDVARLFDWFDDIMHLHSQISSALHATRSSQYPVVIQVAETLRPFIPRLEVHQPYLVRLENVNSAIEAMSKDMCSDFGEFVRIQTASPECESMNLPSFLLKPVQRLMKYPLFFKQLWELTPRSHPDYFPTFSLLHSTDMIIRVMQEVKTREEEYELVKNLASRIKGLPAGYQLARRERRLIAQGLLRRIILSDKERIDLETAMDARESHRSRNPSVSSTPSSSFAGDWAHHPTRTGNMPTSGTDRSLHAESITFETTLDSNASLSRSNSRSTSRSRSSSLRGTLRQRAKETTVYAFVFTDLMILTAPLSERTNLLRSPRNAGENKETWKLIDDLGVSRVLGVTDQSGQLASHEHLIVVELMSMTPNLLNATGDFSDGATAVPVYLSVSDSRTSTQGIGFDALAEPKAKWLEAFEQCFRFTLRSLSFPSYAGNYGTTSGSTDLELDTKSSVMSILSSGLPLPISPSQQLDEAQRGRPTNLIQEEREERGWWSLRFHQVLKEVQRSSRSPVLDTAPYRKSGTRNKHQAGKRSEPRPLILSPNPLITITPSRKGGRLLSLGRKKSK